MAMHGPVGRGRPKSRPVGRQLGGRAQGGWPIARRAIGATQMGANADGQPALGRRPARRRRANDVGGRSALVGGRRGQVAGAGGWAVSVGGRSAWAGGRRERAATRLGQVTGCGIGGQERGNGLG